MKIYNTLTRRLEGFEPLVPGKVSMYTCGPTVYDFAHIGNFRAYVWEDLLRRTFEHLGFEVTQVMNITDIEDKIIGKMAELDLDLDSVVQPFVDAFFEDLATLRIRRAEHYPRATEHIAEMTQLALELRDRGLTYESQGSLYFKIAAFAGYGRLSNLDNRRIKPGARVDSDEYDKEDVRDFVLWKGGKPGEPTWDSPFGPGRPGWHLECSAMSMKYLGQTFDLHTGGVDNIFPHHENEIAQSEGATGRPFVRYWMHVAHLMVDGQKMSKSKGNFYTLRDLLARGFDPRAIRLLLLATHYRTPLNFTLDGLSQSTAEVGRLESLVGRLDREPEGGGRNPSFDEAIRRAERVFGESLTDDLNISGALGAVFGLVREANVALDRGELPRTSRAGLRVALERFDGVLDVFRPAATGYAVDVDDYIKRRDEARKARNWAEADRIREELSAAGIVLEDTPHGTIWRRGLKSR
ncbi:MAG TPA: cysteine--tRNA ligase [Candidatus Polarisedimenticolaceae bacterium]|nr:cysteine--tRNA ligase [Candidatus Polarisedimenticolaceae bacterium]